MKIDFVSDVSCPWCVMGLNALESAIKQVATEVKVELHFQPFELNPTMGADGQNVIEHLHEKYKLSVKQITDMSRLIQTSGAATGFTFSRDQQRRIYNTFDAHRLVHWSQLDGRERDLKKALFKAYFTDGLNPSDWNVLVRLAGEVGLDPTSARAVLESGAYADEVRERERFYETQGIRSVPAVVMDDRHVIVGSQSAEVFERAMRQIATGERA